MTPKTILLVDDDPNALRLIVNILEIEYPNFEFLLASNVDLALKISKLKNLDLVITDWQMPIKSGLELVKLLRLESKNIDVPIIISTGIMTEPENLRTAFETGAVDFLKKPFEKIELIARVKSILLLKEYQNNKIKSKNKELAVHAMYLLKNKELQIKLFKNLKQVIEKLKTDKQLAIKFLYEITQEMYSNVKMDAWNNFEHYFDMIYPNYTQRLTQRFPSLNPAEIRLCIFLRMNMSSKSIADILHNSEDSIKTARKRLRKKLEIDREQNLTNFINSI